MSNKYLSRTGCYAKVKNLFVSSWFKLIVLLKLLVLSRFHLTRLSRPNMHVDLSDGFRLFWILSDFDKQDNCEEI